MQVSFRFSTVKKIVWHKLLFLLLVFWAPSIAAQTITWDQLTDVKFSKQFSAEFGIELLEANFGPSLISSLWILLVLSM